jgi:glycosyltransferase involved in cell wall biosynthesis
MERRKVSGFVPCQNSEAVIRECLESLRWCDEVLVVDGYSTDGTLEIVKEFKNTRIIQHEYKNSVEQKKWALPQARYEWIIQLDSDERCTAGLQQRLEEILSWETIPGYVYKFKMRTRLFGRLLHHDVYTGYKTKRFYRRDIYKTFTQRRVHGRIKPPEPSIYMGDVSVIHDPIRDFGQHWRKMVRYAEWGALDLYDAGKRVFWWNLLLQPLAKFLRFYVLKGGFRDGLSGLIMCIFGGLGVFMKYAKLWELRERGAGQRN